MTDKKNRGESPQGNVDRSLGLFVFFLSYEIWFNSTLNSYLATSKSSLQALDLVSQVKDDMCIFMCILTSYKIVRGSKENSKSENVYFPCSEESFVQMHFDMSHLKYLLENRSHSGEKGVGPGLAMLVQWAGHRGGRGSSAGVWGEGRSHSPVLSPQTVDMSGTFPLKAGDCGVLYLKTSERRMTCFRRDAAEGILTQ